MAIGDLVANLAVAGRPTTVFTLLSNPGGFFVISGGNVLKEAIDTPDGSYMVTIQASVSGVLIATQPFILIFHGGTVNIRVTNTGDTRTTDTGATRIIQP